MRLKCSDAYCEITSDDPCHTRDNFITLLRKRMRCAAVVLTRFNNCQL